MTLQNPIGGPLFGSRLCLARWCDGGTPFPMGFKPPRHGLFGDRVVCAWVETPASLTSWNGFVSLMSRSQATLCTALHAEFVCDKVGTPCLMGVDPLSASRQKTREEREQGGEIRKREAGTLPSCLRGVLKQKAVWGLALGSRLYIKNR